MDAVFITVVVSTFVLCLTVIALINRNRRRNMLSTIILVVLFLLWFGEAALFGFNINPRKAKAKTAYHVYLYQGKNHGDTMSFYLAPDGKPYPTEADYKKTLQK
ncbi:MAG TPA: hypothetical protein VMC41_01670 [Candidatus Nanoarchaeia archaeon]|nr:hypothetical protein [Candidatus Nanoarchaeia archaeon]